LALRVLSKGAGSSQEVELRAASLVAAMGFSKKKSKRKVKADKSMGQKGKNKLKLRNQIEGRKELQASKRKAKEIMGGKPVTRREAEDELEGLDAVDALFADEAFGEDVDGEGEQGGAASDAGSDSEDSSAGAFCDVDDGDDDGLPQEAIEGLEDVGTGAMHEQEMKALKEKDPEFYKFLVENDRALLDFRAPEEEAADEEDEGDGGDASSQKKAGEKAQPPQPTGKVLTMERFKRLQETATTSFTAFKATMNCFHLAVRSIEERQPDAEDEELEEDGGKKKKKKKGGKNAKRKERNTLIRIDDEATFSEVLEWSIANMLPLLKHHAGELQAKKKEHGGFKKGQKRQRADEEADDELESGLVDPTLYSRWPRVKVLAQIFWEETFFLLSHLVDPQMLEYLLRSCSTADALGWLWPFRGLRQRFFKKCCSLWSNASSHKVRLLGFLFIRNSAAMSIHMPAAHDKFDKNVPQLESMIKMLIKSFADVAAMGYSWRSLSTFRFMENCLVELLRLDDATAYRVGYACIRQLALILRNACIASSQSTEKSTKKHASQMKAMSLVGWPFIRAIYLWTKAIGTVAVLKPLAYPLSMIVMGATKTRLTSMQHYPFVHHCIRCLNRLSSSLEVFVPVSSHLLKAFNVLFQSMEKVHRKRGVQGGGGQALSGSKAPDMEVLLRFSEGQLGEVLTLEAVGSSLCFLLTDHLGLLSRSPAFPEVVAPVLLQLKKFGKHCRSEPLRRQLKNMQAAAETSISDVCAQREALTEQPSWKKFLMFEGTTPLAKARADMLKRKAAEEQARVEAQTREEAQPVKGGKTERKAAQIQAAEGEGLSKKAKKRQRQKANKLAEANKATESIEAPTIGKKKTDVVEEMDFSSGEES